MNKTEKNTIRMLLSIIILFGGVILLAMMALFKGIAPPIILPDIIIVFLIMGLYWITFPKPLLVT